MEFPDGEFLEYCPGLGSRVVRRDRQYCERGITHGKLRGTDRLPDDTIERSGEDPSPDM